MAGPTTDKQTPDVQSLPGELHGVARGLLKVMPDTALVPPAFATFCAAAYVKPEWAGPASKFLAELFEDHEDLLADMARIPDLIIELASGHFTLTFMVASRWAAKSDSARMIRLAEALVATQSRMSGPEVVDVMLALATSLAITRYPRAEQLLNAAEPGSGEEHREALAEARLWLGAGRVVRVCTQDVRDLWDHRLRRSRTAWTWDSREEREALSQLADHLDESMEGAALFKAVVPACWWDLAIVRARELEQHEQQRSKLPALVLPPRAEAVPEEYAPVIVINSWPFFLGGLVSAVIWALAVWLGPYDLVKPAPAGGAGTPSDSSSSTATAAPTPAAAAPAADPEAPPVKDAPPAPPTPEQLAQAKVQEEWRREQLTSIAQENADLAEHVQAVKNGTWVENEPLLTGADPALTKDDPRYQKLLLWLHLDPPADPETRAKVPNLLASIRPDSIVLDLWEKLIYAGSANGPDIQAAARRELHGNTSAWSPSQKQTLVRLAGWGQ